jgi:hypothetical protein
MIQLRPPPSLSLYFFCGINLKYSPPPTPPTLIPTAWQHGVTALVFFLFHSLIHVEIHDTHCVCGCRLYVQKKSRCEVCHVGGRRGVPPSLPPLFVCVVVWVIACPHPPVQRGGGGTEE